MWCWKGKEIHFWKKMCNTVWKALQLMYALRLDLHLKLRWLIIISYLGVQNAHTENPFSAVIYLPRRSLLFISKVPQMLEFCFWAWYAVLTSTLCLAVKFSKEGEKAWIPVPTSVRNIMFVRNAVGNETRMVLYPECSLGQEQATRPFFLVGKWPSQRLQC